MIDFWSFCGLLQNKAKKTFKHFKEIILDDGRELQFLSSKPLSGEFAENYACWIFFISSTFLKVLAMCNAATKTKATCRVLWPVYLAQWYASTQYVRASTSTV